MRISELGGLRWSDFDENLKFITLKDETYSRRSTDGEARTTKGKRTRGFPVHERLRPILDRKLGGGPRVGHVFLGPTGQTWRADFVRLALVNQVLKPLAPQFPSADDETGFKDGRLHSFRHFFCSMCANSGVPEPVLTRWLGHRCSAMVQHYYHLHDDESRRQMDKITFDPWAGPM